MVIAEEKIPPPNKRQVLNSISKQGEAISNANKNIISPLAIQLQEARVSATESIKDQQSCLQIFDNGKYLNIATLGNLSLIIGKAKAKKTFYLTLIISVVTGYIIDKLVGTLPKDKNIGIYFDTEQSRYHVQKSLFRICKLRGQTAPENIIVYSLRKYTPAQRLELIEYALYNTLNIGFVVIDGIRDLVTSINDEEQATMITSNILRWTEELDIHIMAVLHQNKGDNNARGHLGAELTNKAETVLSVTKSEIDNTISIVEPEYCRDREFEPFAFTINFYELPEIVDAWQQKSTSKAKTNPIQDLGDRNIYTALTESFSKSQALKYNDLVRQMKLAIQALFDKAIGDNKLKDIITYSKNNGWVIQAANLSPYTLGKYG